MSKRLNCLLRAIGGGLIGLVFGCGGLTSWADIPDSCVLPAEDWAESMTGSLANFGNREFRRAGVGTHIDVVGVAEVIRLEGEEQLKWGIDPGGDEMVVVYFSTRERSQGRVTTAESLEWAYALFLARPQEVAPWQTISLRVTPANGELIAPQDISRGAMALAIDAWQEQGCIGLGTPRTEDR